MFFGFGKCIRRGILIFALLFLLLGCLKRSYPAVGQEVSNWITGKGTASVNRAISVLVDRLAEGANIRQAVEVLYENFGSEQTD